MALPVAYSLLQADSVAIPPESPSRAVALTALVLLVNPETTRALGIRGPGAAEGDQISSACRRDPHQLRAR